MTVGFDDRLTSLGGDSEDTCTASVAIVEVTTEDVCSICAGNAAELPIEMGMPATNIWSMVETVPVPEDGTPEVTPTEVRLTI